MKRILEVLKLSAQYLHERGVQNARREAEELISGVLGCKRLDLYLEFERPLNPEELNQCRALLDRRGQGEPIQYLLGEVNFYDCCLKVTPQVLIPRPETELLVERIAGQIEPEGKTLWDLCCGSGCIGIALKKKFPDLEVICSDLSSEALEVARANAAANGVEVTFLQGDLLAPFAGAQADYVVANPPYIAEAEYSALQREVRDFEPKEALVSGSTGLEFYQRLARELPAHLRPGARVWFEIGRGQGSDIIKFFNAGRVDRDWSGHERFFSLEKES